MVLISSVVVYLCLTLAFRSILMSLYAEIMQPAVANYALHDSEFCDAYD